MIGAISAGAICTAVTSTPTVEYLLIAGGGAGSHGAGGIAAGGGGAGGYKTDASFAVTGGVALTVTIGAGGTGGTSGTPLGTNGVNSVFSSVTSKAILLQP